MDDKRTKPYHTRTPTQDKKRDPVKSEQLDLLACEGLILTFLSNNIIGEDGEVLPITAYGLYDFWRRLQSKKDSMPVDWEQ